ncbi:MAG: magnesium chelatase domain-containing protein [Pseudolabrys sp.]|nr:magnesium chelatase domain-containing protein [Pseudolabrys sp.]
MVQRVATVAFEGIDARAVDVQAQVAPGLPAFNIVGLPDKAVSEAKERVRAALVASGLALPARRITVNLAPADVPKEGSHYDLPIALGLMAAIGAIPRCAADYQGRLSGPLLDRIDLHIEVPAVTAADLILPPPSEGSREVAARVARARDIQAERYAALGAPHVRCNAQASGPMLEDVARADSAGMTLLRDAADRMHLSARGYHRVLRVARTLADLDGAAQVGRVHLAEALSYRALADEVRRAA